MPTNFESESTPPLTPHNELSRIARWQVSEQEFSEASKTSTINLLREFRVEIFRTVALIMIAVAYARPLTTQPRMGILYLLFIVLGAAYYCFLRIEEFRQEGASRRLQDRLIAFADMPIDRGTWLVHLRIHQGETVTGQDFGMMWRDRDFIHFSGLHTSFSLAHSDLSPAASLRIKACKGIRDFRGDVTIPLAMRDVEISVAFGGTAKKFCSRRLDEERSFELHCQTNKHSWWTVTTSRTWSWSVHQPDGTSSHPSDHKTCPDFAWH